MSHEFQVVVPPRKIIVITAPSGAGKSTLVKKLVQQRHDLAFLYPALPAKNAREKPMARNTISYL